MVEDEITCIKPDDSNTITHVGLKKGALNLYLSLFI